MDRYASMELVMVERSFPEPVTFESIQSIEDAGAWCLRLHGVTFQKTYFSRDRRRMLCLYRAPDAESVRRAEREAKVPFDSAWACRWIEDPGNPSRGTFDRSGKEHVVVERAFDEAVHAPTLQGLIEAGRWCFDTHRSLYLGGYLSRDGHRMACHFLGGDAESIRAANRQLDLPMSRVWTSTVHEPSDPQ